MPRISSTEETYKRVFRRYCPRCGAECEFVEYFESTALYRCPKCFMTYVLVRGKSEDYLVEYNPEQFQNGENNQD